MTHMGLYREFNQNSNLWETKQIEKTHAKENNHMHKNTLKKHNSQYTLTLSHPQDKKILYFFYAAATRF